MPTYVLRIITLWSKLALKLCLLLHARRSLSKAHDDQYRSVPFGEELIKEMVMASVFSLPLSQNSAMTAYKLMIQRVTKVAQASAVNERDRDR